MLAGFVQGLPARSDLPRGCYCCDGSGLRRRPLILIDVFYRSPKSTFCAVFGLVSALLMFSNTDFTNSWSSLHGARVSLQLSFLSTNTRLGIRQLEIPTQCLDPSAHRLPPERTRTVLISSSCGYDQDNSHKVTNNDLLFVLSSSRPARHSRHSSSNSLPEPNSYSSHHSPRLASPHLASSWSHPQL
jgi:hypothetical protein